jgi:hypothetical protein
MATTYAMYEVTGAWAQTDNGDSTYDEVAITFASGFEGETDTITLEFQGDAQTERVYIANGIEFTLTVDKLDQTFYSTVWSKSVVTTGLDTAFASLQYFGDDTETQGISCGLRVEGNAIKDVDGVRSTVQVSVWVPSATMFITSPPSLTVREKASQAQLRISANRTAVDISGVALPSVPTGGATYAVVEMA